MKNRLRSLFKRTYHRKGFTLIELLIAMGIMAILMAAVLFTINPSAAQKKARDTTRLRDLVTLQAIIDQWVSAGGEIPVGWTSPRNSGDNGASPDCGTSGWLGLDVCVYANKLPLDPLNKPGVNIAGVAGIPAGCDSSTTEEKNAFYYVAFDEPSGLYEINVAQESTSNCKTINNDGGNSGLWVETGTDLDLDLLIDN